MERIKSLSKLARVALFTGCVALLTAGGLYLLSREGEERFAENEDYYADEGCTIAGIDAHGEFVTYQSSAEPEYTEASSEMILSAIAEAEETESIRGILIDIDSYGGDPVAAQEIEAALRTAKKPTLALIRSAGVSAAYWAATGADHIVASPLSDVGSIGATHSYVDAARFNSDQGYTFNQLSTGQYKDMGNYDKSLTAAERSLIMRDLQIIKDHFVAAVALNRGLERAEVERLADGSTMLGKAAKEAGLIDQLGSYKEAKAWLSEKTGEQPIICW